MKNLRVQRNTWFFAGVCFILGFVISISDGNANYLQYIFSVIAIIASFINAYNAHKKLLQK